MEFRSFGESSKTTVTKKTLNHVKVALDDVLKECGYSIPMNMYSVPPLGKLDLSEAERLVEERIKLLRVFDGKTILTGQEWNELAPGSVKFLLHQVRNWDGGDNFYVVANKKAGRHNLEAARKKDHISHFLLRLYCCRTQELKKWFIWHEMKFLQFQLLDNDNVQSLPEFMAINNFPFQKLSDSNLEGESLKSWLSKRLFFGCRPLIRGIYQMPFKDAMDVIRSRKCLLEKGIAFVMQEDMVGIICSRFKIELSHMMARLVMRLPRLQEEDRLIPIIGAVYQEHVTAADQRAKNDAMLKSRAKITPDMVNTLAIESFPPCMRSIHENLRKDHHLKHYGRLYYSLFLKSIGMTVEDAIEFFRQEFIQKITPEKFAKEYTYNIRYNYGQEGKKVNLSAYGCTKIITSNPPGAGDTHGCPFRHFDKQKLEPMLRRYGIDDDNIKDILSEVEAKNYTGGCTKYFSCKHPNASIRSENGQIYHPNQFFAESRRALRGFVEPMQPEDTEGENVAESAQQAAVSAPEERDPEQFDDDDEDMEAAIDAAIAEAEREAGEAAAAEEKAEEEAAKTGQRGEQREEDAAMEVDPSPHVPSPNPVIT